MLTRWLVPILIFGFSAASCGGGGSDDDCGDNPLDDCSEASYSGDSASFSPSSGSSSGGSCSEDSDCRSGVCDPGTSECVECFEDAHCMLSFESLCDFETRTCTDCVPSRCDGTCDFIYGCVECVENVDCAPNQECASDYRCRDRCLDDSDCPSDNCYADSCGDAIGTPCDIDEIGACHGLSCTDVDANLLTVDPYCTGYCIGTPCPDGFTCQNSDCRRQ